jgi:hypothetical protein
VARLVERRLRGDGTGGEFGLALDAQLVISNVGLRVLHGGELLAIVRFRPLKRDAVWLVIETKEDGAGFAWSSARSILPRLKA